MSIGTITAAPDGVVGWSGRLLFQSVCIERLRDHELPVSPLGSRKRLGHSPAIDGTQGTFDQ